MEWERKERRKGGIEGERDRERKGGRERRREGGREGGREKEGGTQYIWKKECTSNKKQFAMKNKQACTNGGITICPTSDP